VSNPGNEAVYSLPLEIRQWVGIDATIDNEIAVEAQAGDERDVVSLGSSIREAGWDQLPDWPSEVNALMRWANSNEVRTVSLTGAQWNLVLSALARWAAVADRRDDADSGEGGLWEWETAAYLEAALTARGWSSS
jgi:hypothetical protein